MSTKSTIFLTKENIHWYEETNQPNYDGNKFIGFDFILEFDRPHADVEDDGSDTFFVTIKPGSELYERIMKMRMP